MATTPQPIPERQYVFTAGTPAVADQVNTELNTLYSVLQGGVGDQHIATGAGISGSKLASKSVPFAQIENDDYVAFTPTVLGLVLGNCTLVSKWQNLGKKTFGYAIATLGSTSSIVSGGIRFSMPVPPSSDYVDSTPIGAGSFIDASGNAYQVTVAWNKTQGTAYLYLLNATGTFATFQNADITVPFTWGTGCQVTLWFDYKSA